VRLAAGVAGFEFDVPLASRRRDAVRTRRLVATVAVHDIGVSYSFVAERLGMCTGSVSNLVMRSVAGPHFSAMLATLRRMLMAT
jgi:hypothetical protein